MNKEDEELLELYLQYIKKRRIIIFIIILVVIFIGILFSRSYLGNIDENTIINNEINIQEENTQNIVNEVTNNNVIDNTASPPISETSNENNKENMVVENQSKTENNTKEQNENKSTQNNPPTTSEKKEQAKAQKPSNKDFLFTEGYTMDNVSQAAQNYLKSSGYSGECIPLKDDEGIYYRYASCFSLVQTKGK